MRPAAAVRRATTAVTLATALLAAGSTAAHAAPTAKLDVRAVTWAGNYGSQDVFGMRYVPVPREIDAGDVQPQLVGAASTPSPGATITKYEWDPYANGNFVFPGTNPYQLVAGVMGQDRDVAMRVTDSTGASSTARLRFRIVYAPLATIAGPKTATAGTPVEFNGLQGEAWFDNGQPGEIEQYEWDTDGDGTIDRRTGANTPRITHTFTSAGAARCVGLRIVDQNGVESNLSKLCVNVAGAPAPEAGEDPVPAPTTPTSPPAAAAPSAGRLLPAPAGATRIATPVTLSGVRLSRARFRPTRPTGKIEPGRGAWLTLSASDAARMTIRIVRVIRIHTSTGICRNGGPACTVYRTIATNVYPLVKGRNKLAITGRAGPAQTPLASGTYRATVVATSGLSTTAPVTRAFRIAGSA
jgi:hypothetical protein